MALEGGKTTDIQATGAIDENNKEVETSERKEEAREHAVGRDGELNEGEKKKPEQEQATQEQEESQKSETVQDEPDARVSEEVSEEKSAETEGEAATKKDADLAELDEVSDGDFSL